MPLLQTLGLRAVFKPRGKPPVNVIDGLDLSVGEGGIFGLAGESGCGKSMTALSILRILPRNFVSEGSVMFKGRDLIPLSEEDMRPVRGGGIGMVFQEPMTSLNPVMRIGGQISEAITAHMKVSKSEALEMSLGLLKAVRIPSPEIRIREYPHQMSGGMRQRVMIAMAISCNPSLLIADEPTTALDVTIEAQILELIRGLRDERGMSVLLITHDLGVIAENAEDVGIMYAGRLVETASVAELFRRPLHPYTIGLLDSLPKGRGTALKPIPGNVPRPGMLPPGCKFSDRCAHKIPECGKAEPELRAFGGGRFVRCIRAGDIG